MHMIFAADLHVSRGHLTSLLNTAKKEGVARIVIGGDLVPRSQRGGTVKEKIGYQRAYIEGELIPEVMKFKQKNAGVRIYLDMGNDDFAANRDLLVERDGELFHLLHNAKHGLTGEVDIIGYMCVPPTPFSLKDWEKPDTHEAPVTSDFYELSGVFTSGTLRLGDLDLSSQDTIERDMDALSGMVDRPFIFVSHSPPHGSDLDLLADGESHVGSRAIRQFIERWAEEGALIASFHGHIHESAEVSGKALWMAGRVPCHNPGQSFGALKYVTFALP
ncbi:MAG: hypothetical protein GTN70_06265 [Deltaproteobacteria bacterium]|nr:hypothetical protein [Deltaproteobacteria bacterium]NIS77285.1 hypothetical protein [Deltaproteobacteria bacterium]